MNHSGTTVPLFALGSSIHPSFHPRFLVQAEPSEHTPLLDNDSSPHPKPTASNAGDEGEPITREDLDRIMNGGDVESLDSRQEDAILGEGSGLKDWGRGRVTVFREGGKLIICDQEGESDKVRRSDEPGNVSVRRIQ
jgi:hypothetical protein